MNCQTSKFQLLFCYKVADFELHIELLTNGVERLAGILEDVHGFNFGVFEVPHLLH